MLCNKNNLTPFQIFCRNNFPFIEDSIDTLNNYQLFSKIVEYLYNNEMKTTELENLVNDLQNWFDKLDVQDEINNKLDKMVEDGTLQEILIKYLETNSLLVFENVEEMKQASNLINGSKCKTLGYYEANDGGNATYLIRNIVNTDTNNSSLISLNKFAICFFLTIKGPFSFEIPIWYCLLYFE